MLFRSEFGQGIMTGLCQIVAEELKVDWNQVHALQADGSIDPVTGRGVSYPIFTDLCTLKPVNILYGTGGSGATRGRYNALRMAGATAREMLIGAGAYLMGVDRSRLSAVEGAVVVNGTGQSMTYGQLAGEAANLKYCPATAPLTDPADFRIIGQALPRLDIEQKTDGSAVYGIDVRLPGMLYAVVKHAPTLGGALVGTQIGRASCRERV